MGKLCARLYCGSSLLNTFDLHSDFLEYERLLNDFGVHYDDGQDVDVEQVLSKLVHYGYNWLTQFNEDSYSPNFRLELVTINDNNVIVFHKENSIPFYLYIRSMMSYVEKDTHIYLNQWTFEMYKIGTKDMLAKCIVKERPTYDIIYMRSFLREK